MKPNDKRGGLEDSGAPVLSLRVADPSSSNVLAGAPAPQGPLDQAEIDR